MDEQRLWHQLSRHRDDTVLITVTVPGERLEIDVFENGHVGFPGSREARESAWAERALA